MDVILCNESGTQTGLAEICEAHAGSGMLHQAFSIFLFTPDLSKLLMQQRSGQKPLFALQWGNTCCSHPRPGKTLLDSAYARLPEELGIETELTEHAGFVYKAKDPTGQGSEYEFDTVLTGCIAEDTVIAPDPDEIAAVEWIPVAQLQEEFSSHARDFCPWFPLAFDLLPPEFRG